VIADRLDVKRTARRADNAGINPDHTLHSSLKRSCLDPPEEAKKDLDLDWPSSGV
jgi:hypothetical protein